MKKRHFLLIAALSAFAVLTSSIAVATTTSGALNADATETTYTLSINKDNFEKVSRPGSVVTHTARTASGYALDFEVGPEMAPVEGTLGTLRKDGIIRNISKVKGLKKITIEDNDTTQDKTYHMLMGYSIDNGGFLKYVTAEDFSKTLVVENIRPTYFKLVANKEVTITSITLEYSCSETPMPAKYAYPCSIEIVGKPAGAPQYIPLDLNVDADNSVNTNFIGKGVHLEKGWVFNVSYLNTDTKAFYTFMNTSFAKNFGTAFYSQDVQNDGENIKVNVTGDYDITFTIYPKGEHVQGSGRIGAITETTVGLPPVVYVKINSTWQTANPRYAINVFNANEETAWFDGVLVDKAQSIYKFNIVEPQKYSSIIVCRMNGGTTENNWDNRWNQTSDIAPSSNAADNLLTIRNGWDGITGDWSTYTEK